MLHKNVYIVDVGKKMRFLLGILLACAIMAFVACDGGSTSASNSGQGLRDEEKPSKTECFVERLGDKVVQTINVNGLINGTRQVTSYNLQGKRVQLDYDAELYGFDAEDAREFCATVKEQFYYVDSKLIKCGSDYVSFTAWINNENGSTAADVAAGAQRACDTFNEKYGVEDPGEGGEEDEPGNSGNASAETNYPVTECVANVKEDTLTINFGGGGWSAFYTVSFNTPWITSVESYNGVSSDILNDICQSYKRDLDVEEVNCTADAVSYTEYDEEEYSADEIKMVGEFMCQSLLSGELTMEEIWFEE